MRRSTPRPHRPLSLAARAVAQAALAVAAAICFAPGCARTLVADPLNTNYDPDDFSRNIEFTRDLTDRPIISNDEGLHGLIMFSNDEGVDPTTSYSQRVQFARDHAWLSPNWNEEPDLAMRRGTLAPALVSLCKIQGGVLMRTVGPSERYASRELAYLGILSPGSEHQTMSGREFMSILSKAQDYILIEAARRELQEERARNEAERSASAAPPTTE